MDFIKAYRDSFAIFEPAKLPFSCLFLIIFISSMYFLNPEKKKLGKETKSHRLFNALLISAAVTVSINIAATLLFENPINWENPWCIWLTKLQNALIIENQLPPCHSYGKAEENDRHPAESMAGSFRCALYSFACSSD